MGCLVKRLLKPSDKQWQLFAPPLCHTRFVLHHEIHSATMQACFTKDFLVCPGKLKQTGRLVRTNTVQAASCHSHLPPSATLSSACSSVLQTCGWQVQMGPRASLKKNGHLCSLLKARPGTELIVNTPLISLQEMTLFRSVSQNKEQLRTDPALSCNIEDSKCSLTFRSGATVNEC